MKIRFWTMINDDWVKLTLRPYQEINWGKSAPTDEGYESESHAYYWDFENRRLVLQYVNHGVDCDGPLTRGTTYVATVRSYMDRRGRVRFMVETEDVPYDNEDNPRTKWVRASAYVRDVYAEAMGY